MKTVRHIFLLMAMGAFALRPGFAEESAQPPVKAPTRNVNAADKGQAGKKQEPKLGPSGPAVSGKKQNSQPGKAPESNVRNTHANGVNVSPRQNVPKSVRHDTPVVAGRTRTTLGSATAQRQTSLAKAVGAPDNRVITKTTGIHPGTPVSLSQGWLPTSPPLKGVQAGSSSGLTTIGGPAKPNVAGAASLNGSAIKYRP